MKKPESAASKLARAKETKLNRLFYTVLGEDGATEIVECLENKFQKRSMVKRNQDGFVDPHATMVQCGAYEFIDYIKQRIQLGAEGK
jgi:hypothetical protein